MQHFFLNPLNFYALILCVFPLYKTFRQINLESGTNFLKCPAFCKVT